MVSIDCNIHTTFSLAQITISKMKCNDKTLKGKMPIKQKKSFLFENFTNNYGKIRIKEVLQRTC
jgi:hypothetical protein